ncbi:MAG: hypothetical protein FRX49_01760 [Trebouxia sp. A1-2]|nr:MAG: hypothetical protein FRX49_01760 [Trebouxia sp. A1-2]
MGTDSSPWNPSRGLWASNIQEQKGTAGTVQVVLTYCRVFSRQQASFCLEGSPQAVLQDTSVQASPALTSEAAMDQQVVAKLDGDDAGLSE